MKFKVSVASAFIAALSWASVSSAQPPATPKALYSGKPMSADELEAYFGMTAPPAAPAASQVVTRGLGVQFGAGRPNDTGAQASRGGPSLSLPILFTVGSDSIDPASRAQLAGLSELLQRHSDMILLVIGHTDNTGSARANQALSQRRANTVRQALIGSGVPEAQVAAMGQGAARMLPDAAPNSEPQRRVEFVPVRGG